MTPEIFRTEPVDVSLREKINESQEKVSGFDLRIYQAASIVMIGAGGIGSNIAQALVRKGIGKLVILDDDIVEAKNLTRQLFSLDDIGKNKALAQGPWLARQGMFETEIHAYPYRLQELIEEGCSVPKADALICGVDNNTTRITAADFGYAHGIPVITPAVCREGNQLYCAVQEPGGACFGCMFPEALNDDSYPCNLPGIIDVLQVVSGLAVYAVDSLLCGRHRNWNLRNLSLDGVLEGSALTIERNPECLLCGKEYHS